MRTISFILLCISFSLASCVSFITEGEMAQIKKMEAKVYRLKKNLNIEGKRLSQNTIVRIVVRREKGWIKVYAYPARVSRLKAELVRVLYLFDSDFPGKHFNYKIFQSKLSEFLEASGENALKKKKKRKRKTIKKRIRRKLKRKRYRSRKK